MRFSSVSSATILPSIIIAVTDLFYEVEEVSGDYYALAVFLHIEYELAYLAGSDDVKSVCWLVKNYELRIVDNRNYQRYLLSLSL